MTRIVTAHYRYKSPPRKRKAVALEAPTIVTTKRSRRPVLGETAAEVPAALPPFREEGASQPSTPRAATRVASPPANDEREPAIVTATNKKQLKLLRGQAGSGPRWRPEMRAWILQAMQGARRAMIDANHGLPTPRTTPRACYVTSRLQKRLAAH